MLLNLYALPGILCIFWKYEKSREIASDFEGRNIHMVDGKYSIVMQTPWAGEWNVDTYDDGMRLSGILEADGRRHPFTGGTVRG